MNYSRFPKRFGTGKQKTGKGMLKSQYLWWYEGVLVHMVWITFTLKVKAPLMLKAKYRLWSNVLSSRQYLFQGCLCLFLQDNVKPHSACFTTVWLCGKRLQVLDWPTCIPDLKGVGHYNLQNMISVTLNCWGIRQKWERILLSKLQQLASSFPKCLLSNIKMMM